MAVEFATALPAKHSSDRGGRDDRRWAKAHQQSEFAGRRPWSKQVRPLHTQVLHVASASPGRGRLLLRVTLRSSQAAQSRRC